MLLLTKEELKSCQDAKNCYIYGKIILKKLSRCINYPNVRDHCHYTGKYRSAAHNICNLTCQVTLKKTEVKLWLLTDINMLLMIENGIRGGICHAIHQYAKANN